MHSIKVETSGRDGWKEVDLSEIEFGMVPSDHMFIADYDGDKWKNATVVPYGNTGVSPFTAALHYGQTVFEGMKAFRMDDNNIALFRPLEHARRFNRSLERMCMPAVPESLFIEALDTLLSLDSDWVPLQKGASLYIRPFVFATDERLGVRVSQTYRFMIVSSPAMDYFKRPLRVKIEQHYSRSFPGGTGYAKCGGNYGASFYPFEKARSEGFDQLLWTDALTHQFIEESGMMNAGFIIDNIFITPSIGDTILQGITRKSVLQLATLHGLSPEEREVNYQEIINAIESGSRVEAFGMGTAAVIAPIESISVDGMTYETYTGDDAVMFRLRDHIEAIRTGSEPDVFSWNHIIAVDSEVTMQR